MTKIIAQEQKENNATETAAQGLRNNIDSGLEQAADALTRALQQLNVLKTNVEYAAGETATTLKLFIDRLNKFKMIIEKGSQEKLQNLGPLENLPTPSVDDTDATLAYNQAQDQLSVFRRHLLRIYPQVNQFITMVKAPIDKKEDWALKHISRLRDYENIVTLSKMMGFNKAARLTQAYPVSYQWRPPAPPANIKEWKTIATQISAFKRAYPEYTFPQVLYHFTQDWDMFDRYKFKNWYKWTQRKAEANKVMEKKALQDIVMQDQAQKFQKKKKLLLSRIDLVRKCLRDLMGNSLISADKGNKIYKILAMLEYEAYGIAAPKLAAARFRRGGKQLQKLGFSEGSEVLYAAAKEFLNPKPIIKTAADDDVDLGLKSVEDKEGKDKSRAKQTSDVLRRIKTQMDKLSYTKHLDELFYIKKDLEDMGRDGDAESILKIIKDDLDGLDKLNKKLTDVYTNLSRLPVELSMNEDKAMGAEESHDKIEDMPIEVKEEDLESLEAPKPKAPVVAPEQAAKPVMPKAPASIPAAPRPAAPKIKTEIPNV